MDDTTAQQRSPDEATGDVVEQPRAEAAARAVARMLANPRRIRRN